MTPQERAAELCFKLALLVDADTHMEVDQDAMKAITEALTATRRAALLEAAEVAEKRKNDSALGHVRDAYSYVEANLRKLAQEG